MKKTVMVLLIGAALSTLMASCSKNDDSNDSYQPIEGKTGTLLVTFGSSYGYYDGEDTSPYAYQKPKATYDNVLKQFQTAFPKEEVRFAYTSSIILNKLRKDGKANLDFPNEALKTMAKEGFSEITVQSLHIIPGAEFNEMLSLVNEFKAQYPKVKIKIGEPLLKDDSDIQKVADYLTSNYKAQLDRKEAVVLMGHGNSKFPQYNVYYEKLQELVKKQHPEYLLFIGTVEGTPTLDEVVNKLKASSITDKKVTLAPLMSIAGDHANNDMASPDSKSWKSIIENAGFTVAPELIGLGAHKEIVSIWISHKNNAL